MTNNAKTETPYEKLNPNIMFEAVENCGFVTDGRYLELNSYENRVYQIGIEESEPIIAKFYRPGRWSTESILEEHSFALEIAAQEIPVIAPWQDESNQTLHSHEDYQYALYPRKGGHWPDLEHKEHRKWMGRLIARIHSVGSLTRFDHRPTLNIETFGIEPSQYLLENNFLPSHIEVAYQTLLHDLLEQISTAFEHAGELRNIRLHGDCHPGNILWSHDGPHFVDLDDCRMGPAVQDLWMLLSGDQNEMGGQLSDVLEGYQEFADFDYRQLHIIEALRTLRMIHYAAWLAKRWVDPAFPKAFPWFNTPRYWEDHILSLREQAATLNEPILAV